LLPVEGGELFNGLDGFAHLRYDLQVIISICSIKQRGDRYLTSSFSGPLTVSSRKKSSAFWRTRLLIATPSTPPKDLHNIRVLVTTACSDWSETARTAMKLPGNMKPLPIAEGTRTSKNSQSGRPLVMKRRQAVPNNRNTVPATKGALRRRV
jgi:hypothetical protein